MASAPLIGFAVETRTSAAPAKTSCGAARAGNTAPSQIWSSRWRTGIKRSLRVEWNKMKNSCNSEIQGKALKTPRTAGQRNLLHRPCASLADDFDQGPFAAAPVKLAVEDLLPRPEVEPALGDRHHHFAPHNLPFHMGVRIVLSRAIMPVLGCRGVWRELFQPDIVVLKQAALRVVDEDRSGDVHRVHEAKAFLHPAFLDEFLDGIRDVDKPAPVRHFKPKMFRQRFHDIRINELKIMAGVNPPTILCLLDQFMVLLTGLGEHSKLSQLR